MSDHFQSGLWSKEEARLSINVRELLAVENGLRAFLPLLKGHSVAVFCNNTTAISYLRHQEGTFVSDPQRCSSASPLLGRGSRDSSLSPICHGETQRGGGCPVPSGSGSRFGVDPAPGSFRLRKRWPVMLDLFATSLNHRIR